MKNLSRGRRMGSEQMSLGDLRAALDRLDVSFGDHVYYGKVVERDGDAANRHFTTVTDDGGNSTDILVCVDIGPEQIPVTARLGSLCGSGAGDGDWKVPGVGAAVLVTVPGGQIEAGPVIVTCLSNAQVPSELDATTRVIKNSAGDIRIVAGGTQVHLTKDGDVDITTSSGHAVNINGSTYSGLKFDGSFETDMANVITGLLAGTQGGPTAQQLVAAQTALNTMLTNLQNGSYRSSKVKLG